MSAGWCTLLLKLYLWTTTEIVCLLLFKNSSCNFYVLLLFFLFSLYDSGDRITAIHNNRRRYETPKRLELVHLDPSPQYCERNLSTGSLGTVDRPCNLTAHGLDSCDLLCCGRGHNIHQLLKRWQCRCKFIWCCHVKCDICHERIEQYTCK